MQRKFYAPIRGDRIVWVTVQEELDFYAWFPPLSKFVVHAGLFDDYWRDGDFLWLPVSEINAYQLVTGGQVGPPAPPLDDTPHNLLRRDIMAKYDASPHFRTFDEVFVDTLKDYK